MHVFHMFCALLLAAIWGFNFIFIQFALQDMSPLMFIKRHNFCALYCVRLSTWIGYGLWNWLLGRYAISMLVPFTFLVPIFAMFGSVLILHEPLHSWKILAGVLVLSGLCINLFSSKLPSKLKLQDEVNLLEKF